MPKKSAPKKSAPVEEQDVDLEETEAEETDVELEEEAEEEVEEKEEPAPKNKNTKPPATKSGVIFVNKEKYNRAKDIILLVTGKRAPHEASEIEKKDRYTDLLATRGVKATDANAVQAVYEILGGLVRTPEEQAAADKAAAAARAKFKRRRVEQDKVE